MRAAIHRVDVVGKAEDRLGVAVVVLQRDIHFDAVAQRLHADRLLVQDLLALVQMLNELRDSARIAELGALGFAGLRIRYALVSERDLQALVQESQLAQTLGEHVVVVFGDRKNGPVRQESEPWFPNAW